MYIKQINKEQHGLNKIQINRIMDKLRLGGHDVVRMPYAMMPYILNLPMQAKIYQISSKIIILIK